MAPVAWRPPLCSSAFVLLPALALAQDSTKDLKAISPDAVVASDVIYACVESDGLRDGNARDGRL